ncbi:ABC transporter ATP-binding protein [Lacticaseibacillus camelliae]|uniref:ABC transporter n=1 Tax=Lacticaseibacillus camelliae DSM 22697 = JCM 13995 TaxID=1423730 RepID=A0A0R2F2R1_9LACO|nr:ABC transporter ATP-binding protein [Lacticaseibacillus camelliae]KRN19132.1 ABC transporter [Lacticaseibacillus camelliae DSM 22697 = JCM 13995]
MAMIATRHLTRTYGKGAAQFTALHDVNMQIEAGEALAIVGKSGSGKSTLLHLLALLDQPTKGTVVLNGRDTHQLKTRQLNALRSATFGFVFQQFFLNSKDTVYDNVVLPLKIAGVTGKARRERGLAALREVGLLDKAKNKATALSGGQKQRVCIARALVNRPKIIFADEPTGNLDSVTGQMIEDLLFKLNREHGITLILVTHDPDLAAKCDRQLQIRDGQLVGGECDEIA